MKDNIKYWDELWTKGGYPKKNLYAIKEDNSDGKSEDFLVGIYDDAKIGLCDSKIIGVADSFKLWE